MTTGAHIRTEVLMGTFVTIHVIGRDADRAQAVERAFGWFREIEQRCTRFDPASELMQLSACVGTPVRVSALLYETVQFALAVAEETGGAFDPTLGHVLERRGFDREHRTGRPISTTLDPGAGASYRDVRLDPEQHTITLLRPLVLDLGAVAKGFAVDMAARELRPFTHFAIDAGGDLYLGGLNATGGPWSVGIRHPRREGELIESLRVSDKAVCTSGDYERRSGGTRDGHHLLDPRTGEPANTVASVTVVAPTAMLADALATAAFVLGPVDGIHLFDRLGVDGLIFSASLDRHATRTLDHA